MDAGSKFVSTDAVDPDDVSPDGPGVAPDEWVGPLFAPLGAVVSPVGLLVSPVGPFDSPVGSARLPFSAAPDPDRRVIPPPRLIGRPTRADGGGIKLIPTGMYTNPITSTGNYSG